MPDRKNDADPATLAAGLRPDAPAPGIHPISGGADGDPTIVQLDRTPFPVTPDQVLWTAIRAATDALSFNSYQTFMDAVICADEDGRAPTAREAKARADVMRLRAWRALPFPDVEPYRLLKVATEVFLTLHCGVVGVDQNPEQLDRHGDPRASDEKLLPPFDAKRIDEENRRRSIRTLDKNGILRAWSQYRDPVRRNSAHGGEEIDFTIPYLAIVRRKLGDIPLVGQDDEDEGRDETKPGERGSSARRARGDRDADRGNHVDEKAWVTFCYGIMREKLTKPCLLELIWSYWHEEGMLVQTLNAISQRFQNVRGGRNNPLANLEIAPLRPISNLLWGFIQDEQHRLSVRRRVYEYDHHYGLTLYGKAVPELSSADSRSKFVEAFHNLLQLCAEFYKRDDDKTVVADAFPVLNSLKDVHLLLSEGQHNQYGDLPWTARIEMLLQQWLLARPEFREFLPTRQMVAYPETWMDRVDAMKKLQGWTDTSVLHFRNLGVFGEQILLCARFAAWSDINDATHAANFARYWRPEIQGYIHAYRAVTGVDITDTSETSRGLRYVMPSIHLRQRLNGQPGALPAGQPGSLTPGRTVAPPPVPARVQPQPAREW